MEEEGIAPPDSATESKAAKTALKQMAVTSLPVEVGSVAIGDDGHIHRSDCERALHFQFSACGVQFVADLASRDAPLRLRANLGKLPYSAESPEARQMARTVLSATSRLRRGQILLSPDHDMMLEGELPPPSPRTPVSVIATAVALILDFKPYLDLLGDAVAIRRTPPQPPTEDSGTPTPEQG